MPPVVPASDRHRTPAADLAARLDTRVLEHEAWRQHRPASVVLWLDDQGLGLLGPPAGAKPRYPLPVPPRRRGGRELLLRALGPHPSRLHVVDATAGWGVDASLMLAVGARVTMIERSQAVAVMLAHALDRWRAHGIDAADRLALLTGEAADLLEQVQDADVVYLDPFYPGREDRGTTAAELAWLRALVAAEERGGRRSRPAQPDDARGARLLAAARAAAHARVVVKRPRSAPPLAGVAPSGSLGGRVVRFDLYPGTRSRGP